MTTAPTAAVLIIGNEILSGRTVDANLNYLAVQLSQKGILLREARVIPDVREVIVATVNELRAKFTYIFTTGGIGPTHDDITAACVAEAFGLPLVRHPDAVARLDEYYKGLNDTLTEIRLRMANMPEGATLLENPVSGAPGFKIGNVHVLPGVPRILRGIFDLLLPSLAGGPPVVSRTVGSFLKESEIAVQFEVIQNEYPQLDLGSYPSLRDGKPYTSLVAKGTDEAAVEAAFAKIFEMVKALGGTPEVVDAKATA